jgi:hypothetical protein
MKFEKIKSQYCVLSKFSIFNFHHLEFFQAKDFKNLSILSNKQLKQFSKLLYLNIYNNLENCFNCLFESVLKLLFHRKIHVLFESCDAKVR